MLTFISTPSHGFLQVSRFDVEGSGYKPSRFSFIDPETDRMYLEEDCDAPGFLKAANLQTHPIREINVDWHHGKTWMRLSGEGFVSPFEHYER